jgi:hypothetical protein
MRRTSSATCRRCTNSSARIGARGLALTPHCSYPLGSVALSLLCTLIRAGRVGAGAWEGEPPRAEPTCRAISAGSSLSGDWMILGAILSTGSGEKFQHHAGQS